MHIEISVDASNFLPSPDKEQTQLYIPENKEGIIKYALEQCFIQSIWFIYDNMFKLFKLNT